MPQLIAPLDILTSNGSYPEREQSDECTSQVRVNSADLAERCSKLFAHLGVNPRVTSGFRTATANKAAKGATRSAHLTGEAADFADKDGTLALKITDALLEQFDLYMENEHYTKGWVHLQTRRTRLGSRRFNP